MVNYRMFNGIKGLTLCLLALLLFFTSCVGSLQPVKVSDMSLGELSECVSLGEYKGLEIKLNGSSRESAILWHIEANTSIKYYPAGAVDYYVDQLKKQYKYYADQADMRYEAMLDELGQDNITMQAEARKMVKRDIILAMIQKREEISISDAEKTAYFDKYIKKYAERYNYEEDYVREELVELVYDSMLYDKTVEFLIINNTFIEDAAEGQTESSADKDDVSK